MALKVFISYSTKDLNVVEFARTMLSGPTIEVFVAEYSAAPVWNTGRILPVQTVSHEASASLDAKTSA